MPKDNQKLKALVSVMHSLAGFSQVQSEPSRKLDQCDKQSHLDLFNPFQEQFKQFLSDLDHFKCELLNRRLY